MYKDGSDFRRDYPNAYTKGGDVYDGNNNHVGRRKCKVCGCKF